MSAALVFGVDEAGRGPLIGPMVVAVVATGPRAVATLAELGVDDSKRFGSGPRARIRRAELAAEIERHVDRFAVHVCDPEVIDDHVTRGELNVLERKIAAKLLEELQAPRHADIICDGARVFGPLREHFSSLVAVDRGESAHVSVAAASILAKHARDEAFAAIAARYESEFGELRGGGYINPPTRAFIERYRTVYGDLPPEARRTWKIAF